MSLLLLSLVTVGAALTAAIAYESALRREPEGVDDPWPEAVAPRTWFLPPPSPVVRLDGTLRVIGEGLRSPVTGETCAMFERVEAPGSVPFGGKVPVDERCVREFAIETDHGRIRVLPGTRFRLHAKLVSTPNGTERFARDGDYVRVHGVLRTDFERHGYRNSSAVKILEPLDNEPLEVIVVARFSA